MTTLIKTNVNGFYKDPNTGAVINMNEDEYRMYKSQKNQHKEFMKTLNQVDELKRELEELKRLMLEKVNA